jgi:hypothetical protein
MIRISCISIDYYQYPFRAKYLTEKHQERILEAVRYPKQSTVALKKRNSNLGLMIDIRLKTRSDFEHIKFYTEPSTFESFRGSYTLDSSSNRFNYLCQSQ